jgi:hypothetical protein
MSRKYDTKDPRVQRAEVRGQKSQGMQGKSEIRGQRSDRRHQTNPESISAAREFINLDLMEGAY